MPAHEAVVCQSMGGPVRALQAVREGFVKRGRGVSECVETHTHTHTGMAVIQTQCGQHTLVSSS